MAVELHAPRSAASIARARVVVGRAGSPVDIGELGRSECSQRFHARSRLPCSRGRIRPLRSLGRNRCRSTTRGTFRGGLVLENEGELMVAVGFAVSTEPP
jgi:hypothetical protein